MRMNTLFDMWAWLIDVYVSTVLIIVIDNQIEMLSLPLAVYEVTADGFPAQSTSNVALWGFYCC